MNQNDFIVIGSGLAGSEAALTLAAAGARVSLFEQKPHHLSPVHKLTTPAELVCSNSLKSRTVTSSHGLLKKELEMLNSPVLKCAEAAAVPGGQALAVDREKFSQLVDEAIKNEPLITVIHERVDEVILGKKTLIATGPLTSDLLMQDLLKKLGDNGLYFYDATSPIVSLDSLDMNFFYWGAREGNTDYLNLPLNKDQYIKFREDLLSAEKTGSHDGIEELQFFEGCLPVEELARRGEDTLAFSCMKPVGLRSPSGERAYAVIQFRREKAAGELLNMVGFQTRMKWPEQERVFKSLPGMKDAQFMRLGAMHRNSFINAPRHLCENLELKNMPGVYMAGQITGSEGYTEALATGHYAALRMLGFSRLPETSAIQSLVRYMIESDPAYFQPMNFNFGLLPPVQDLLELQLKEKKARKERFDIKMLRNQIRSTRALQDLEVWVSTNLKSKLPPSSLPKSGSALTAPTVTEHEKLISNDS